MSHSIVTPIIRLDWALDLLDGDVDEVDLESVTTQLLSEVLEIINSIRSCHPAANVAVAVNPAILSGAVPPQQEQSDAHEHQSQTLRQFQALTDSGIVEIINTPLVSNISKLAITPLKLHFLTALSGALNLGCNAGSSDSRGLAGVTMTEVDVISSTTDLDLCYAVCDADVGFSGPTYVARSDDGVVCFCCPLPKEYRLWGANNRVLSACVFHLHDLSQSMEIVLATDLPRMMSGLESDTQITTPGQIARELIVPRTHRRKKEVNVTTYHKTIQGLDVAELIKRVEGLFVKLLCETLERSIQMMRKKLEPREESPTGGSALSLFLCRKALAKEAARIRLKHWKTKELAGVEPPRNKMLEDASRVRILLSSASEGAAKSASEEGLTKRFLDLMAQTFWFYEVCCSLPAEKSSVASREMAWAKALAEWIDTVLFYSPQIAVSKIPKLPNIPSVRMIRKSLTWGSLGYDMSAINEAMNGAIKELVKPKFAT